MEIKTTIDMNHLIKLSMGLLIFASLFGCKKNDKITKESITTVTKEKQMIFVWSFNAILNKQNGAYNDIFGGEIKIKENEASYKEALNEWWDITDKNSLLTSINDLTNGNMHHQTFKDDFTSFLNGSEADFQNELKETPEYKDLMQELWENKTTLKQKGIIAWDQIRAIGIIGWGYQAGYITLDEAYSFCLNVGSKLQANFGSYEAMITNYNIGYFIWANNLVDYNTRKAAAITIFKNPSSLWNIFPFEYDLSKK